MAKKSGSGKSTGKGDDDEFISFTPTAGFDIRHAAADFCEMMEELGQPLIIHFPNVSVEFEPGCTRKQVIDGYNQGLKASMSVKAANFNAKKKD